MKQNITLAFDSSLLRKIKAFAAARGESISGLLREHFSRLLGVEDDYVAKQKTAIAQMKRGIKRHGTAPYYTDRSELHER